MLSRTQVRRTRAFYPGRAWRARCVKILDSPWVCPPLCTPKTLLPLPLWHRRGRLSTRHAACATRGSLRRGAMPPFAHGGPAGGFEQEYTVSTERPVFSARYKSSNHASRSARFTAHGARNPLILRQLTYSILSNRNFLHGCARWSQLLCHLSDQLRATVNVSWNPGK